MAARLNRFTLRLLLFAAAGFLYVPLASSHQANQQMKSPERPCTLVVSVRSPDGSPLDTPAIVNLFTFSGSSAGIGVFRAGTAEFANLSPASYTLEIIAAGYQRLKENVQLMSSGERQHLSIFLTPESVPSAASPPSGSPILAPNAEKEVTKALEDLRTNKPEDARKHLEKASRAAAAHPDISYLWGMYYAQLKDYEKAKVYWEKAVQIAPRHVFSLAALAQLALQSSDYPTATGYLLRASEAAPSVWRYHERLAETYLNQRQYEEAGKHAQRALELGKERAAGVQFVLAQTFLHRQNSQNSNQSVARIPDCSAFRSPRRGSAEAPGQAAKAGIDCSRPRRKHPDTCKLEPAHRAFACCRPHAASHVDATRCRRQHARSRVHSRLPTAEHSRRGGKACQRLRRCRQPHRCHGVARKRSYRSLRPSCQARFTQLLLCRFRATGASRDVHHGGIPQRHDGPRSVSRAHCHSRPDRSCDGLSSRLCGGLRSRM